MVFAAHHAVPEVSDNFFHLRDSKPCGHQNCKGCFQMDSNGFNDTSVKESHKRREIERKLLLRKQDSVGESSPDLKMVTKETGVQCVSTR